MSSLANLKPVFNHVTFYCKAITTIFASSLIKWARHNLRVVKHYIYGQHSNLKVGIMNTFNRWIVRLLHVTQGNVNISRQTLTR